MTSMNWQFFSVTDNSFSKRGFPWVSKIRSDRVLQHCPTCGSVIGEETRDVYALLMRNKGTKWPDVLGTGSESLFIVSERVLETFCIEGVGDFPAQRVHILEPLPKTLKDHHPPKYFWLNGVKMKWALLDFESSGFVEPKVCPKCKHVVSYNMDATYELQHTKLCPYTFIPGSWKGMNLFTTNLSSGVFFCTDAVLECARKYKLTNFRFIPVEQGAGYWTEPVKYM